MEEKIKSIIQFLAAFIFGSVCYVIGFVVGTVGMGLMNSLILILPPAADLNWSSLLAAAVAANAFGIFVFGAIDKNAKHMIAFCVWLIFVALVYAILCFVSGDFNLLPYPVVCVLFDGSVLGDCIFKKNEAK